MAIDNFDLIIQEILRFESPEEFFFIQIIRRAKDNNQLGSNNQWIKSYSVYSHQDLLEKKIRIIDLCNRLNARAYIHPAARNDRVVSLMILEELAKIMREQQYANARNLYATMCGRYNPPKGKKLWTIDCDGSNYEAIDTILDDIRNCQPVGNKVKVVVPTKNGQHYITIPFDLQAFKQYHPDIEVHKNNPTVLYCP